MYYRTSNAVHEITTIITKLKKYACKEGKLWGGRQPGNIGGRKW